MSKINPLPKSSPLQKTHFLGIVLRQLSLSVRDPQPAALCKEILCHFTSCTYLIKPILEIDFHNTQEGGNGIQASELLLSEITRHMFYGKRYENTRIASAGRGKDTWKLRFASFSSWWIFFEIINVLN